MRTWTDSVGRLWTIALDNPTRDLIERDMGLRLNRDCNPAIVARLRAMLADPRRRLDLLACVCQRQAKRWGISRGQFGNLIRSQPKAIKAAAVREIDQCLSDFIESSVWELERPAGPQACKPVRSHRRSQFNRAYKTRGPWVSRH